MVLARAFLVFFLISGCASVPLDNESNENSSAERAPSPESEPPLAAPREAPESPSTPRLGPLPPPADAVPEALPPATSNASAPSPPLESEADPAATNPLVATPAELARRSARDYGDNEAGLVTAARLESWVADWARNKPADVAGDLIVLQFDPVAGDAPYLASAPGVRVYLAAELTYLREPRHNGIAAIGAVPSNGIRVDSFMRRMRIRPNHDFVLLVAGEAASTSLSTLASAWLFFRYWGLHHESLGLLNGAIADVVHDELLSAEVAAHPFDGDVRIHTEPQDHFSLLADLGAVRDAIGRELIADARPVEEYEGTHFGASALDETCLEGVPSCTPVFSGRIRGAVSLPWTELLQEDGAFKSRDALVELARNAGIDASKTAYVYDLEGDGSAILSFAFLAILAQPARWYAASYLEWGAFNASHPEPALRTLSEESPWRTDRFPELSEGVAAWAEPGFGVRPLVFDDAAESSTRVQDQDADYKKNPPELPAAGAGEGGC